MQSQVHLNRKIIVRSYSSKENKGGVFQAKRTERTKIVDPHFFKMSLKSIQCGWNAVSRRKRGWRTKPSRS